MGALQRDGHALPLLFNEKELSTLKMKSLQVAIFSDEEYEQAAHPTDLFQAWR
jgi:hypothetical protein